MSVKLLLIANTTEEIQLGAMLRRASASLNLSFAVCDTHEYAPSMKYLWGKVFFLLGNKRPLEWWRFNRSVVQKIQEFIPHIVLITGIFPLSSEVFQACRNINAKIANYLTDDPWNPQHGCPPYLANLPEYDSIFSTKRGIMSDLSKAGVPQIQFLPFAFDPETHYPPQTSTHASNPSPPAVCLIGGADPQRLRFIKEFYEHFPGELGLYGAYWHRDKVLSPLAQGIVYGDMYRQIVRFCKVNIGLVRRANRDEHSMRSYEIAACGGVGIYEDTSEHRDLLKGYPDYGFFSSPQDLSTKCQWLLQHPEEHEALRQIGIQQVVQETNTYTARLQTILDHLKADG